MKALVCLVALVSIVVGSPLKQKPDSKWWQKAIFYQIYPRSFMDWNGDGIGDLRGLIHKIEYLKTLEIDAICLSPIFTSPMEDFGYDVSNFMDIDPVFGTLKDFNELIVTAKYFDLKVILDFVPNHSSDQHEWFQKSLQRIDPYTNYYVWHNGKLDELGIRVPPNNWEDLFGGGSAWTWREERQQYYLHQFHPKEPDLNYDDPNLVQEMKDVLRFWLGLGVDGFRASSIANLYEEPAFEVSHYETAPKNHLPETYDMVKQWRKLLDGYTTETGETKVLMVGAHGTVDQVMEYYGARDHPGAHLVLNSKLITDLNQTSSAYDFTRVINEYLSKTDDLHYPNWMLGNHDESRVASRFGPQLVDAMNMLSLILPGPSFTYYGEEIGMEDTEVSWERCLDPRGLNAGPEHYMEKTRDPGRGPFQWDDTVNAGFSFRGKTWLPVNENYIKMNVDVESGKWKSHLNIYRMFSYFRKIPASQTGEWKVEAFSDTIFAVVRGVSRMKYKSREGNDTYIFIVNLGNDYEMVELTDKFYYMPEMVEVIIDCSHCPYDVGTTLASDALLVLPKQSMILGTTGKDDKPVLYEYVNIRRKEMVLSQFPDEL